MTECAISYFFNSYSQALVLHRRTDGIRTPHFLTVNDGTQCEVLTLHIVELFLQMFWHIECDGDAVAGQCLNAGNAQAVK